MLIALQRRLRLASCSMCSATPLTKEGQQLAFAAPSRSRCPADAADARPPGRPPHHRTHAARTAARTATGAGRVQFGVRVPPLPPCRVVEGPLGGRSTRSRPPAWNSPCSRSWVLLVCFHLCTSPPPTQVCAYSGIEDICIAVDVSPNCWPPRSFFYAGGGSGSGREVWKLALGVRCGPLP